MRVLGNSFFSLVETAEQSPARLTALVMLWVTDACWTSRGSLEKLTCARIQDFAGGLWHWLAVLLGLCCFALKGKEAFTSLHDR